MYKSHRLMLELFSIIGENLKPVSVGIVDEVKPELLVFETNAPHLFVQFMGRFIVIHLKRDMRFVVAQIVWALFIPKPGKLDAALAIRHKANFVAAIAGFLLSFNAKPQRFLIKVDAAL